MQMSHTHTDTAVEIWLCRRGGSFSVTIGTPNGVKVNHRKRDWVFEDGEAVPFLGSRNPRQDGPIQMFQIIIPGVSVDIIRKVLLAAAPHIDAIIDRVRESTRAESFL